MMGNNKRNSPRRKLTRCRTGCTRCRVRRRKCDEGKPRCRNCITRNFKCEYAQQLTFLVKNARTVAPREIDDEAPASYDAIRFVNEGPSKNNESAEKPGPTSCLVESSPNINPQPENQPSSHEAATSSAVDASTLAINSTMPFWPPESSSSHPQHSTRRHTPRDKSVVVDLLPPAIRMADTAIAGSALDPSSFAVPSPPRDTSYITATTPSTIFGSRLSIFSPRRIGQTVDSKSMETLKLLRYYRYEIAPWLDLCDLGQSFGINALQLAMALPPVRTSILELSETSINQLQSLQPSKGPASEQYDSPNVPLDLTAIALLNAFVETKGYIKNVSDAWSHRGEHNLELLSTLYFRTADRNLESAIYWLLARFEIGAALANGSSVHIPLPLSLPYLVDVNSTGDPFGRIFHFAHRPLWLCARALRLVHGDDSLPECLLRQNWMQLVDELERWYHERPQEFQPMLELGIDDKLAGPEHSFPTVLFANGPGVFGNQLYHTAMLVLVQSRPRTIHIAGFRSTAMSPLWHAQRVCGIAIHNDRQECWDPCLLASFLMAAHRMTHESQQQEILRTFDRIRTVTGFDVGERLKVLQREWRLLDAT